MKRSQIVIQCAEDVLFRNDIEPGPGAPDAIVKKYRILLRYYDLGSLKGFYTILNGHDCIGININLSDFERKEALSHELGHCFLHKGLAEETILSDYDLYRLHIHTEWEANLFAALILVPCFDPEITKSHSFGSLAALLGVSEEMLSLRFQCNELILKNNLSRFLPSEESS